MKGAGSKTKMKVTQKTIAGIIFLLVITGGTTIYLKETSDSPDYDVCRKGVYGEWVNVSEIKYVSEFAPGLGQYHCALENVTRWCRKTTTTRCYFVDIDPVRNSKPVIIANITPEPRYSFNILQEDQYIEPEINFLGNATYELTLSEKEPLPDKYTWGMFACTNETTEIFNAIGSKIQHRNTNNEWCGKSGNRGAQILAKRVRNLPITLEFKLAYEENLSFLINGGQGTFIVVVNSSNKGAGSNQVSFGDRVFYDPNNDRWHILYMSNTAALTSISSSDGTTWVNITTISSTTTFSYQDFDCALDVPNSTTYLHCVYGSGISQIAYYIRCELTGTQPFISCGSENTYLSDSITGIETGDDIANMKIILDSNRCVVSAFDFEDDSLGTQTEHQISVTREASTCGDGTFGVTDHDTSYPMFGIQSDDGFAGVVPIGIRGFGDLDFNIYFIDRDSSSSADYMVVFFNGSSDATGTEEIMDTDIEWATGWAGHAAVINGSTSLAFGLDDGTNDLDSYKVIKNSGTTTQTDTLIGMADVSNFPGPVAAVVDNESSSGGDIWVFAQDSADTNDIYYSITPDLGTNWNNQTLWQDEAGTTNVYYLSAFFAPSTCDIMVVWQGGTTSPFATTVGVINTGNCPAPPVEEVKDINLSFGPDGVSVFRFEICGPSFENASAVPQEQNSTHGIDYICNNGTGAGSINIKLSGALNTNWTWYASNTSISSDLITLTTSPQTIYSSLAEDACIYIWHKANCSFVNEGPGAYEIYNIT